MNFGQILDDVMRGMWTFYRLYAIVILRKIVEFHTLISSNFIHEIHERNNQEKD